MKPGTRLFAVWALLSAPNIACSQSSFEATLPRASDAADIQILRGVAVIEPRKWPATVTFRGLDHKPCTATIIGPQVLLTAAHCVEHDSTGVVTVNKVATTVRCQRHTNHHDVEYDIAVCVSEVEIRLEKAGDGYERVGIDPKIPKVGVKLQLLGYGCTSASLPTYGLLYEGVATVDEAPSSGSPKIRTQGGSAACAGDSGGAAYLESKGGRVIVGINSRATGETTMLAALTDPRTLDFVKRTKTKGQNGRLEQARICGLDLTLHTCHR